VPSGVRDNRGMRAREEAIHRYTPARNAEPFAYENLMTTFPSSGHRSFGDVRIPLSEIATPKGDNRMNANRCIPIVFDYVELRLRMPVRRPDDPFMREAGIQLPISKVL
jgi:hypothetical protein